jgi:hypothetical protein
MGCTLTQTRGPGDSSNLTTLSMLYKPFPNQFDSQSRLLYQRTDPSSSKLDHTVPSQRVHKAELWAACAGDVPEPWGLNVVEKLKQAQALYNMKEGWNVTKEMKVDRDINQQTRHAEDSEWDIVRSDGLINESGLAILSVLMNYRLRGRYDSMWESGGVVDSLGRDTRITYLRTKRKMFIVRDMVLLTHEIFLKDETIISLSFSIKTAKCPPQRGVVRTHCKFQCWILRPIRDTDNASLHKTHVTLMTHIDPRGTVGLGKPYYYNLFGAKPVQNLRSYIHKQTSAHGYRRIRQSMYNFFVSQNREETIHDISDNEASGDSPGFYDEVKNLNAKLDKVPVSKLIDRRLRYRGVKNPPPASPKKPKARDKVTPIDIPSKQRRSLDCKPLPEDQRRSTVEGDEKTPTATNRSLTHNEYSSSAGNSVKVIESSSAVKPENVVVHASQRVQV